MLKVEVTDGNYIFGQLINPNDPERVLSSREIQLFDWIPINEVPNEAGNSFWYGWLESIGQSDNAPGFMWGNKPLSIRVIDAN